MTAPPVRWREPVFVAIGGVLLMAVLAQGITTPSLWYDEAATYSGASRPWSSLWEMLGHIDAVHGTYYALMHPIATTFGPDPFALRITSTLAVGVTAALVYALARQFGTPWSSAAAALLFAGLGRTAWMSTEARSFALATALSTLLTLLLVLALRSQRHVTLLAVAYAVTAVVGIHVFLYVSLVVVAHVCTIVWLRPPRRRGARMLAAAAAALALSIPLGLASVSQRGQLGGTFPLDADSVRHVMIGEFFHRERLQGILAWSALAIAVAVLLVRRRRSDTSNAQHVPPTPWPVLIPWLVLPTAAILAVSALGPSILQPRALVLSAPAFCVLLAELLRRAFGGVTAVVVAIAIGVAGAGAYSANRELTAKNADWPVVVQHLQEVAAPEEGVLYSTPIDYRTWPSLIGLMHEREVGDLVDVTLLVPGRDRPTLFAERSDSATAIPQLSQLDRVFYVYSRKLSDAERAPDIAALQAAGLTLDEEWSGPLTGVETWVRTDG